jgi:DNA-directed RNA polymerase subunit RPC12/RpoP
MTLTEFASIRESRACGACGRIGVETQFNPNNGGLLVRCPHCGSKQPWGSVLFLKQRNKPSTRPPLPHGETLDAIWARFGNRCVLCSAPRSFLERVGIGLQVHHVLPYAEAGHRGPVVPICSQCHEMANWRQRCYWFMRREVMKSVDGTCEERDAMTDSLTDDPVLVTQSLAKRAKR